MARIFEARYFVGMTAAEISEEFEIPLRTAERSLAYSRACGSRRDCGRRRREPKANRERGTLEPEPGAFPRVDRPDWTPAAPCLDEIAGTDPRWPRNWSNAPGRRGGAADHRPGRTAVDALLNGPDLDDETVFGPYRIKELIGRGGMGTVYRAVRDDTGQDVAIRCSAWPGPRSSIANDLPGAAHTLARLNHAFIAHLRRRYVRRRTPWFAMEPSAAACRSRSTAGTAIWTSPTASSCFAMFRQAVRHAHRQAIIHRDLKPRTSSSATRA